MSVNIKFGRATTETPSEPSSQPSEGNNLAKRQVIRTFLQQKPHRVHQNVLLRKLVYYITTAIALSVGWAIGYYKLSWIWLGLLVAVMAVLWNEQTKKIARATEQEIEIKLRRKKTQHLSETAEWVNLAINRWWMVSSKSLVGFLKDYMEPLLQEAVPIGIESLELVEFDLGSNTPFIKSIQIFDVPSKTPPNEYTNPNTTVVIANVDIGLIAPDSKIGLKARLGGKKLGYSTMVYVEGIHLSGNVQATVTINYSAPFPHVGCISATFVRVPDIHYSIKILKGFKVTDIPFLKSWINTVIMSIFQSLLVDPGRIEIDLMASSPSNIINPESSRRAHGVLTITISGNPPNEKSKYADDPRRWFTFRLNDQKYQFQVPVGQDYWKVTYSFLVYDLQEDVLIVKCKHRRVMYTMTLAMHSVKLSVLELLSEEYNGHRCIYLNNTEAKLEFDMAYTILPHFSLNSPISMNATQQVAGVLYIHVHSGTELMSSDADGLSDPYCIVLANKKKVLTTHYILDNLNPKWERGVEFFVSDYSLISLTFLVYDWDGPLIGDDLLGVCKMNLVREQPQIIQQNLPLEIDGSTTKASGHITVSVIFRPVDSVAKSELPGFSPVLQQNIQVHPPSSPKDYKQSWKKVKGLGLTMADFGVLELSIIEGRNLKAMDRNGYSDPYVVVKYGGQEVYRTQHVLKTLNPKWNCRCTLSAPPPSIPIVIECWDKDQFTNDDFMGSLAITSTQLSMFKQGPQWFTLEHVENGELLLELKKSEGTQDSLSSGDIPTVGEHSRSSSITSRPSPLLSEDPPTIITTPSSETNIIDQDPTTSLPKIHSQSYNVLPATTSIQPPSPAHSPSVVRRRHTLTATKPPSVSSKRRSKSPSIGSGDSSLSNSSGVLNYSFGSAENFHKMSTARRFTADPVSLSTERRGLLLEAGSTSTNRIPAFYYLVNGEVNQADGLKGKLDHMELYVKIRLNSHPSHLRREKFDRGNVVHRTRKLPASSSLQWRESFSVKESPVSSDSLLTVDLKSGPKVTLGTHVITLDKFFEGNISATKWLHLGNNMRIMMHLSRQSTHEHTDYGNKLKS